MPRILSPAYFHHYNAITPPQTPLEAETSVISKPGQRLGKQKAEKTRENEGEQLVLGLGPVQNSFWRLSRLVPLEGVRRQLDRYQGKKVDPIEKSLISDSGLTSSINDAVTPLQSLEIQEDSDGISLRPLAETDDESTAEAKNGKLMGKSTTSHGNKRAWRPMPSLPSYVPFGQVDAHIVVMILFHVSFSDWLFHIH